MSRKPAVGRRAALALATVLAAGLAPSALRAESRFSGDFLLGFRTVSTRGPGADAKYREDIDLRGGPRLFSLNLSFVADGEIKKYVDRFELHILNLGGDPYESISASLQKYGSYLLKYDRRKSSTFYRDLTQVEGGGVYDLHTLDFERISDTGSAKIWLGRNADLYFDFDRYTREGAGTTTQDIGQKIFVFDQPIREESKQAGAGFDVHLKRFSLFFEERYAKFSTANGCFLPGLSTGLSGDLPTELDDFALNQPFNLKTTIECLRFDARPFDRLSVSGSARFSHVDEDFSYTQVDSGVDEFGWNVRDQLAGRGDLRRDIRLYEINATYQVQSRLSLIGAVRYHRFEQTGSLTEDGETQSADDAFDTVGVDAGLQYAFTSRLVLTLGYRFEDRRLDNVETATFALSTRKNGGFGSLRWDPARRWKLTLEYEHSACEDPFTLISPTSFDRLRASARYQMGPFSLTASYLFHQSKTDIEEDPFEIRRQQASLRAGCHAGRLQASVSFSYLSSRRTGLRTVSYLPWWTGPGGTFLWNVFYEGKADILDADLSWEVSRRWRLGGWASAYSNTGSYDNRRTMIKIYVEYVFSGGYVAQAGYRFADFREPLLGFNNYRADIFEFSFGYRWQ